MRFLAIISLTGMLLGCNSDGKVMSRTLAQMDKYCIHGVGYYSMTRKLAVAMKPDSTVYVCNSKGEWK